MTGANNSSKLTELVKKKALKLGADVVGVASVSMWDMPPPVELQKIPVYPQSGYQPNELLPTARSVIVLGLGQLLGVMECNLTDASTTYAYGNFGYVHINRVMNAICFDLARWLEACSWPTLPLGPIIGSRYDHMAEKDESIISPLYSIFSLKRSAVIAGLGRKARNGLVANPILGTRIRFAALITSAPLKGDPLLDGDPCPSNCKICLHVCPTQAITPDGRVNHYKCSSDCGRRGKTWTEIKSQIKSLYPVDLPGTDYTANDNFSIDSSGNRLCKVACMAFCPLGQNTPKNLSRRVKDWEKNHPKVKLSCSFGKREQVKKILE